MAYEKEEIHSIENSKMVIERLKEITITNKTKLMSLGIKDMYTKIPIAKTVEVIKKNKLSNVEWKKEIIEGLELCLSQNYFRFNNKFYIQENGLPVGSPLSPLMAEIFMNSFEIKILKDIDKERIIKKWIMYVDDILIVWEGEVNEFKKTVSKFIIEIVRMAANLNNTKNKTCELQADKYKNVREFFKYLKIKAKGKKR